MNALRTQFSPSRKRLAGTALAIGAAATLLTGCAGQNLVAYAQAQPALDLATYFNGPVVAHGMFQDRSGQVVKRFVVQIDSHWQGNQGVLDERFRYDDGSTQQRVWRLTRHADGRYTGQADDDAGGREQQVLELEVAADLLLGRAQRAPGADHAGALLHPEAGQPHDAHRRHQQQAHAHAAHQPGHGAILGIEVAAHLGQAPALGHDARLAARKPDEKLALVLDIDETVLDNSPYQARLIRSGGEFNEAEWAARVFRPMELFVGL